MDAEKKAKLARCCDPRDGGRSFWDPDAGIPEKSVEAMRWEVEFSNWFVNDLAAHEPAKVTRRIRVGNLIDDDLNLLPPLSAASSSSNKRNNNQEKEEYGDNKENSYDDDDDELNRNKKKIGDALLKRKRLAQEEDRLLNELNRVRLRAAEIDEEYREYQEKIAIIN